MSNTEKIIVQVQVKGQRQLENLGKTTDKATKRVGGLTKNIAAMGAGILGAVAAFRQINRFITSSIKTFRDFEFQMSKVKAITGASTEDFLKLSQTAEDLGRTTFFTAQQVAELQTNFGKLGFTTQEILDAQKATLDLATATGSDLARAATVAGASVRGFGLDASETQRVVDVMAVSFTSSAMDIEKFQTSMTKVAPIAKASGFSLEDTTAIMSKLTDAGIEASIAGTSLRNILLKMQDPNSDLVKSFGQTIHSYDQLIPAMNKFVAEGGSMANIMEVVDLRQAAAFEQMISNTDATLALRDAMLNANGAAERMAAIVGDNLEGAFKRLNSAFEGLLINFTESVLGKSLQRAVDGFANLLNVVSDFIDIPMSEKLEEERKQMNLLFEVLKDTSTSQEVRNKAIQTLNTQYGAYLPNLVTEKNTVKELSEHQANANKQLAEKIKMMGAEERLNEIQKESQKIASEMFDVQLRITENQKKMGTNQEEFFTDFNTGVKTSITGVEIMNDKLRLQDLDEEYTTFIDKLNEAIRVAEEFGIKLQTNDPVVKNNTGVVVESTKAIEKNTKAKEDNAISTDFLTTVSDDYFNSLMEDVINGTATIEEQEQKLRDFQVDLLNNLLQDEQLTYEQRVQLEKQLNALKLQNMDTEEQARQKNIDSVAALGDQLITLAGEDEKMQGIRRVGIALSSTAAIANNLLALSNAAVGVSAQSTQPFPLNIVAMITTLSTLASLFANIKSLGSVFEDGGIVEKFANGGMVHGKSHAFGGEKFAVGGRVVELEGGEAVINKRSTAMFRNQLSAMNAAGGGVKFADGGLLNMPSFTQQQFNAVGQNQMMGAVSQGSKVVVVESDITQAQQSVSVIESQVTF
tara:strand:- start:2097 stop:4685 length:2589 start_codon:yes stop_codon:yes gene_type:complete